MMSTLEMSATMNANRTLIDARLDAIDRALLGRVSRAERLDVVGEVESRIDELLRERRGPGAEPTREDVLAVLARLDPPEAYLGDEAPSHESGERPAARARATSPDVPTPPSGTWNGPAILGLSAAILGILFPIGWVVMAITNNGLVLALLWGLSATGMMLVGGTAAGLGLLERPRRAATMIGLIVGSAAFGFGLAVAVTFVLFMFA